MKTNKWKNENASTQYQTYTLYVILNINIKVDHHTGGKWFFYGPTYWKNKSSSDYPQFSTYTVTCQYILLFEWGYCLHCNPTHVGKICIKLLISDRLISENEMLWLNWQRQCPIPRALEQIFQIYIFSSNILGTQPLFDSWPTRHWWCRGQRHLHLGWCGHQRGDGFLCRALVSGCCKGDDDETTITPHGDY